MRKLLPLRASERGAAAIEMAIALPILVLMLWGIFQIGIAGQAIAGMQHGLGEGARLATLCVNPTTTGTCSTPTDDAIKQRVRDKVFGVGVGTFADPVITTPDPTVCTNCKDLSVTFSMPMNFLFFTGPNINLTQSKRVYMAY
jgi:Flp pilus assembly protein TadG